MHIAARRQPLRGSQRRPRLNPTTTPHMISRSSRDLRANDCHYVRMYTLLAIG